MELEKERYFTYRLSHASIWALELMLVYKKARLGIKRNDGIYDLLSGVPLNLSTKEGYVKVFSIFKASEDEILKYKQYIEKMSPKDKSDYTYFMQKQAEISSHSLSLRKRKI